MVVIKHPSEIGNFIEKPLTPSEWYHVTQEKINNFAEATSDHQWIHVDDCLLYTSPSPRDATLSRMPSSA